MVVPSDEMVNVEMKPWLRPVAGVSEPVYANTYVSESTWRNWLLYSFNSVKL